MNIKSEIKFKKCLECGVEVKQIGKHLKIHNLSPKDYYDKYLKRIDEGICISIDCNKETKFRRLDEGYPKTCSNSCARKVNHTDPKYAKIISDRFLDMHKNEEYKISNSILRSNLMKERHKDIKFQEMGKRSASETLYKINRSESHIKSRSEIYISKAIEKGVNRAIFYIMKLPSYIKIGICYYEDNLIHFFKRVQRIKPISWEIYVGAIEEVSDFERLIKISYSPTKCTEYFNLDLYEEIKSKIPNTILPYSTLVV
jgi:hypothetical protein